MHFTLEKPDAIYTTTNILGGWVVVSLFVVRNSKTISQIKAHTYITGKMDGDSENCLRLHGACHKQREAQHGGGGGGDDDYFQKYFWQNIFTMFIELDKSCRHHHEWVTLSKFSQ